MTDQIEMQAVVAEVQRRFPLEWEIAVLTVALRDARQATAGNGSAPGPGRPSSSASGD